MNFFVATPVFNGQQGLRRCIGSVRAQAGPGRVVRHHLQDGGSTDDSVAVLDVCASPADEAYAYSYTSEKDRGMYDAINRAWDRAGDADVYSWLNADEQYLPGAFARVNAYFESHPDADAVFGDMIIVDQAGTPLAARREVPFRPWYIKHDFLYSASCTLFFRHRLRESGVLTFDTSYRLAGDMDLMLRLAQSGARIGHIDAYQALFEADANALSVRRHAEMEEEVRKIRVTYGGSNHPARRLLAKACRVLERAGRGCYRLDHIAVQYALDETPTYRELRAKSLGSRFTYERFDMKSV
jgi:glycosyltransferase involved in cell wall biosynthesis